MARWRKQFRRNEMTIRKSQSSVGAKSSASPKGRAALFMLAVAPVVALASSAFAANGTANYLDLNGATPGFGGTSPITVNLADAIWTTDINGVTPAPGLIGTNPQVTIGAVATDFAN